MEFFAALFDFGEPDQQQQLREFQRTIRRDKRQCGKKTYRIPTYFCNVMNYCVVREIRGLMKEEKKLIHDMNRCAKKGYDERVKQHAVTVVRARKHKQRLAQMISHVCCLVRGFQLFLRIKMMLILIA